MSPCATRSFTPIVFLCACVFFVAPPSAGAAGDDPQPAIAAAAAPVSAPGATALKRPAALPALYVSFAGLQALDIHSTLAAIDRGARETNPIVGSAVGSPAVLIG